MTLALLTPTTDAERYAKVAIVIPCFRVARHIEAVIRGIPPSFATIICVDDQSPDDSAAVIEGLKDSRVHLIRREKNGGVGAAMKTGYLKALELGAEVCVKLDGDGQMDPAHLPSLLAPVLSGEADYSKGNRFVDQRALRQMPAVRLFGNAVLSFATKAASGYWNSLDPTNGYTAISARALGRIDLDQVADRYFFESSLLVELNIAGSVLADVELPARYGDEESSLSVARVALTFPFLLSRSVLRRFYWRYLISDFGAVTLCVLSGIPALLFGLIFGVWHWVRSVGSGVPATAGTVVLAALPVLLGAQLLLTAAVLDVLGSRTLKRGRRE